ncbi:MAG: amidohydrolase family protein [Acidobacteriota bacterium]
MAGMKRKISEILSLTMLLFLHLSWVQAAGLEADLVLYNGKILTADSEDPARFTVAEAVAAYDGKFVVVGSNQEAMETAGPSTRRIDLAGRTVLPGLIETHLHVHTQATGHYQVRPVDRTDAPIQWTNKADGLAQLRTLALQKKLGDWIVVSNLGSRVEAKILSESSPERPTLAELDRATPRNPLVIVLGGNDPLLLNSRSLNMLLQRYPQGIPGIVKDQDGKPNGVLLSAAAYTMKEFYPELSAQEVEELAPVFKKELEEPAARGVTTVGTRMDRYSLRVYHLQDDREEMHIRLDYGTQMAAYHPLAELLFRRVPGRAGHGSPWLWLGGASMLTVEGSFGPRIGAACIHGTYPREAVNFPAWLQQPWGPHGDCRLTGDSNDTVLRDGLLAAARFGWPITNIHINGDRSLDDYMDLLEEAERKYQIQPAALRFSVDHCGYVTEEQAQRAKRLGITFTCTPISFADAEKQILGAYALIYDRDRAADSVTPFRRLVRLGLTPAIHCEGHQDWAFTCLQYAITRRDKATGQVWGSQQRINRQEALYTYTRWAAWHVWKEKNIGSIEPGKWADMVVLDQDYLTVPEDAISEINPLLTIVGGQIRYSNPNYAASEGLPTVGFQAPPDWWQR